ncbi:MAG: 50S ribosomal protein L25 [Candidatus Firestonebacteria bacterium]
MEEIVLEVKNRVEKGKNAAGRLRVQGIIPAILYGEKTSPIPLSVDLKTFQKIMVKSGENALIVVKFDDGTSKTTIVKEIQYNPVKGNIYHIDFYEVSLKNKITVDVPVEVFGESAGVKNGGILEYHLRTISVKCLPTKIPENIKIDITSLQIGGSIHISDVKLEEDIEILAKKEEAILSVSAPTELKEEEPIVAGPTEPEVIGEKEREERRLATEVTKEERKKDKESAKDKATTPEKEK